MIRRIKDEDAKELVEIYNYYIKNTNITLELRELTEKEYLDRIHQVTAFYPWLVYEEDGKILGFAYLDKFNSRKAYLTTADLSIYVSYDSIRKGIGLELYKEIEKLGLSLGICKIISIITKENNRSILFHKRLGFKEICNIDHVAFKFGKWVSVTFMEKNIQTLIMDNLNKDEPTYRKK